MFIPFSIMKLIISNINKINYECQSISEYINRLTSDDLYRYNNISNPLRKRQFLIGRMLIYENYGYNFFINKNGKLCTEDKYISLSHSENLVILAISKEKIGVDVENITKKRDFENIGRFLNFCNDFENDIEFYSQFTAYEADYKAEIDNQTIFHSYYIIDNFLICISQPNENVDIKIYDSIPFEEKREIVLKTFNTKK